MTDVILGKESGRTSDKERILIYDYGLAIHDLYFAAQILKLAKDTVFAQINVSYNWLQLSLENGKGRIFK